MRGPVMATIKKQEAINRLAQAVKAAHADDLVEIHNELFPEAPVREEKADADPSAVVDKIVAHIASGLEVEEVLDLWNVIFPMHCRVWFDEDEGLMHYEEKIERVGQVD
jgi:hypothetical protein